MKNAIICLVAGFLALASSFSLAEISTVDRVSVLNGYLAESLYYYENNWMIYRREALQRGYISDFKLMVDASQPGEETLLLITEYPDRSRFEAREENFAQVMSGGSGPNLLNSVTPGEFRTVDDLGVFEH